MPKSVNIATAERPSWPISRAAFECGVSRDTIKRRRAAGAFPNAHQNSQGLWLIPIADLLAEGFAPRMHQGSALVQPLDALGHAPVQEEDNRVIALEQQVHLLQVQIDAERQLRAAAERNADDLRTSLRMIEATPAPVTIPHITPAPENLKAKGWWRRR